MDESRKQIRDKRRKVGDPRICDKWYTGRGLREAIDKENLEYKKGKFCKYEIDIINKVLEKYESLNDDFEKENIFKRNIMGDKSINSYLRDILADIANKLPGKRPLVSIYVFIRSLLDTRKGKGKFTKEEQDALLDYISVHGTDWKSISALMNRTQRELREKYKSLFNRGIVKWTEDETSTLREAVGEALSIGRETGRSPWDYISEKVGKSKLACMNEWYKVSRESKSEKWTDITNWRLCNMLYDMCLEEEGEIDWAELANDFQQWSHTMLKSKWRLLLKRVNNHEYKSIDACILEILETIPYKGKKETDK